MTRLKLIVSPFYRGEEWTDEGTGITFKRNDTADVTTYSVPEDTKDFSGIRKAIKLNALILVEGIVPNEEMKEEKIVKEEPAKEEPAKEKNEEQVKASQKPKASAQKRSAKKE